MDDTCRKYSAVAKKAKIAPKTFDAMINGRQEIDITRLIVICTVLGVPASRIVDPQPGEEPGAE
jgi:transcriptional regulator with XRE-family HTH domain